MSFRVEAENNAATIQKRVFSSDQLIDIEAADGGGEVVWRWSHDKFFTDSFWNFELKAGESYVRNPEWDLKDNSS